MEEKMKVLIGLQACDTKIRNLERKIAEGPLKIRTLEDKLIQIVKECEEAEKQLDELQVERRGIEKDVEMLDSQIGKANNKLSNIKSNKEYRAALKEIEDLNSQKSRLEDKTLQLMEQMETLSNQCQEKKKGKEDFQQEIAVQKEDIRQKTLIMDQDLKTLAEKRQEYCSNVDGELLKRYNFIRERKAGLALSPVRDAVCLTCNMEIPPQKFIELIKGESLLICPNCHRIIYWGDNEKFQTAGGRE